MTDEKSTVIDILEKTMIILCILLLIGAGLWLLMGYMSPFVTYGVRAKTPNAKADMRSLATALECYWVDNGCYPPHTYDPALKVSWYGPRDVPTFNSRYSVTTPIAYISQLRPDVYNETKSGNSTFCYWTNGMQSWMLVSRGPDEDFDIDFRSFEAAINYIAIDDQGTTRLMQDGSISRDILTRLTYDATNGLESSGDIFRYAPDNMEFGPRVKSEYTPRFPGDIKRVVKTSETLKNY